MANSDAEGLIYFPTADFGDDQPHDALNARCAMNNAIHLADQAGRVLVNYALAENGAVLTNTSESDSRDRWHIIARFGPFILTLDDDGVPYPIRIRVAGHSSAAATQTDMRVVVAPRGMSRDYVNATGAGADTLPNVAEVSSSSIITAWLTTTIAGSAGTLLTVSRTLADAAYVSALPTIDGIGGSAITIKSYDWECVVFGQNTGSSEVEPVLDSLYLAEYVGT